MKGEEKTSFLSAFQEEAGAYAPPDRRGVEGVWAAEPLFSGFIADLCRFSVRRYVWGGICGFLTMCWKTDKASLVKGRGTACGGGIGKKGVQSLRRSAPAPFDKGAFWLGGIEGRRVL